MLLFFCYMQYGVSFRLVYQNNVFNLNIFHVGLLSRVKSELLDSSVSQTDDIDSQSFWQKSKDMCMNYCYIEELFSSHFKDISVNAT